jgi:hypothetical protein
MISEAMKDACYYGAWELGSRLQGELVPSFSAP